MVVWTSQDLYGCRGRGKARDYPDKPVTPRAALATAEVRAKRGEKVTVAFAVSETPETLKGWCVEVRQGCVVRRACRPTDKGHCLVAAEINTCCLDCDVYSLVLIDDKCVECATVYLDLMKREGYGQSGEACTCGCCGD